MILTKARKQHMIEMIRQADLTDSSRKQFGSSKHQYALNPPISADEVRCLERQYGFQLPEDYFWFITEAGNGGAGPDYGLYSFGSSWQTGDFERLGLPCVLGPKDTSEAYHKFIARYDSDDCDEEEYDRLQAELWQGLLTIGTAGCTYDMMLVVTGEDRGRILHVDRDLQRPYFSPDGSFLDWYERWLTETAAEYQMRGFHSRIGGNEYQFMDQYAQADEQGKNEIVNAIFKFQRVGTDTVKQMAGFFETEMDAQRKSAWLRHLERLGYEHIDDLIRQALTEAELSEAALGSLSNHFRIEPTKENQWAARWKPELDDWYADILAAFALVAKVSPDDHGAFYCIVELLTGSGRFQAEDLEPFLSLENEGQVAWLYYKLSEKPMPHRMVMRYLLWLKENCQIRKDDRISSALSECLSVRKFNPTEAAYIEGELIPVCMGLLRNFAQQPPKRENPYLRDNVYQTLDALGKDRRWVDKNR